MLSLSPTELIHLELSSLQILFRHPFILEALAPQSFGSGTELSEACNTLEARSVKLHLENINISNLHSFRTALPVPKSIETAAGSSILLLCVCVCVCARALLSVCIG